MDSEIFTDYVRKLDAMFHKEGHKIVLIIDNCPAHPEMENLKAIELVFLPANTTSKTQPMDHGVIRALKAFYRSNVVKRQFKYIDAGKEVPVISILEAMRVLVNSWEAVSINTVINCFKKAGISKETQTASINDEDGPFKSLAENINELKKRGLAKDRFDADEFIDIDFTISTNNTTILTEEEIVESIVNDTDGQSVEEED